MQKPIFIDIGSIAYFKNLLARPDADRVLDNILRDMELDEDRGAEYEAKERPDRWDFE
jgi:hypothetical protein